MGDFASDYDNLTPAQKRALAAEQKRRGQLTPKERLAEDKQRFADQSKKNSSWFRRRKSNPE